MPALLQTFFVTLIRAGLVWASGWLVNHSVFSNSDMEKYITAASIFIVTMAWSFWEKYKSRLTFLTALTAPAGATEAEVKQMVKDKAPTGNTVFLNKPLDPNK